MWHHAGRPTTGHCEETIGINIISPQETEHYTLMRNKWKIKARISPKNELDLPLSFNELSKSESYFKRLSSFKPGDINIIRKLSIRRNQFLESKRSALVTSDAIFLPLYLPQASVGIVCSILSRWPHDRLLQRSAATFFAILSSWNNARFPLIVFWITKTIALLYLASSVRLYWLLNISFNI